MVAVEKKIPSISNVVKKTDYNTKITEIEKKLTDHNHDKYITTPEFNKLGAIVFNVRLVQANLVTKTDFDAKLSSICLLKMIWVIFTVKIILMKMVHRIIIYFSQYENI